MHKELKSAVLALLLVAASYYFGDVCGRIGQGYELILSPSRETLGLGLRFFLAMGIVVITASLVAALVRPRWACFIVFGLSALAMLLGWGLEARGGLLAGVYLVASLIYAERIAGELNDRLSFSVSSISQEQRILITALLVVACGSFYFGYSAEISRDGFSIPPFLIDVAVERMEKEIGRLLPVDLEEAVLTRFRAEVERVVDEMEKEVASYLPAAQTEAIMVEFRRRLQGVLGQIEGEASERLQGIGRDAVVAQFREQFEITLVELVEETIRPYEQWIPAILAVSLFTLLGTIAALLSWIPMVALLAIFPLLTALGLTKVVSETGIVRRLTLG